MSTKSTIILLAAFVLAALAVPRTGAAQNHNAASLLYSQGVHAYFAGNSSRAVDHLSQALEINQHDPRIYYFRALSLMRLGRSNEARGNMYVGAALEAQRPSRFAVGTALERVQGANRLLLEQYRSQARLERSAHREQLSRARYEQMTGREADVLRRGVVTSLDQLFPTAGGSAAARGPQIALPARPALEAPAATTTGPRADDASVNPFADDPAPPEVETPIAAERPAPAPAPPAEEDDPFGFGAVESGGAAGASDEESPDDEAEPSDSDAEFGVDDVDPFGEF